MGVMAQLLGAAIGEGTPLLLAALGCLLSERVGIINLGAEGMMLMGAVSTALVSAQGGDVWVALVCGAAAGGVLGVLHALTTVTLLANQIVSGLAITLFGTGLSAYLGKPIAGNPVPGAIPVLNLPLLDKIPWIGPVFAHLDVVVWFSVILAVALFLYIERTSWGLNLRAVGDSPATADVMGIHVLRHRYAYVVLGGMLVGLSGAYLLFSTSPSWVEGMTAGRGWIAVALVIFARWNPVRAVFGAYLFGGLDALGFRIQLMGTETPSYFLKMLPYVLTVVVLMILGLRSRRRYSGMPLSLGSAYVREERS
ncbi:MAG TPA: ABC transporter permease [Alicyclobacillus sp.]|nr:ABC transporter permease [Alicyclobacillus sp.]